MTTSFLRCVCLIFVDSELELVCLAVQSFWEIDTNKDGVIEYDEFIPGMMAILQEEKGVPAAAQGSKQKKKLNPATCSDEQLNGYLKELFKIGDKNGDGVLQPSELVKLLGLCGFGLNSSQILDLVSKADTNGDGVIEYDEFVPVATALLRKPAAPARTASAGKVSWASLAGDELAGYLKGLFDIADANKDGVLQLPEFVKLMRLSGLGFDDDVILKGFTAADTNQDGVIDADEFIPGMMRILQTANSVSQGRLPFHASQTDPAQMLDYVKRLFAIGDVNGDGVLSQTELTKLLNLCGFNLSPSSILDIILEADKNGDGVIDIDEFVPIAAKLLAAAPKVAAPAQQDAKGEAWSDLPDNELEAYVNKLFNLCDSDGDGSLQPKEFVNLMRLSRVGFPDELILDVFNDVDRNADGVIQYDEFVGGVMSSLRDAKASLSGAPASEPRRLASVAGPAGDALRHAAFTKNAWMGPAASASFNRGLGGNHPGAFQRPTVI